MSQREIELILWPPNSPHLNPIEAVWHRMKDCIQRRYPNVGGGKQRTQDTPGKMVKEAWHYVSPEDLVRPIESIPARSQAVVDAYRGPTRY